MPATVYKRIVHCVLVRKRMDRIGIEDLFCKTDSSFPLFFCLYRTFRGICNLLWLRPSRTSSSGMGHGRIQMGLLSEETIFFR